jgi:hypothetical protein
MVRQASLSCLSSAMNTKAPSGEISLLLKENASSTSPDLIQQLTEMVEKNPQVEAYLALASVARAYYAEMA